MKTVRLVLSRILFYVVVALVGTFFVLPLLWLLVAPFDAKANLAVTLPSHPTLANFRAVLQNSFAMRALARNTIIQAGGTMLGTTFIATLAAYALSRTAVPAKDLLVYILMLFSSVVTGTAAMVPIFLLIYHLGLIDTQLAVILTLTGGLLPSGIFMMRDFVEGIPRSYEESAMVAGANPFQVFRDVVLPLVRPGMMVVAIWAFVNAWGTFLIPFILLRSPENMPASVAIYSFYTEAGTPIITLVSAYALLYTIPVVVLYLLVNWRYGFRFFGGIKR